MAWLDPPSLCHNGLAATNNLCLFAQLGTCSKLNVRGATPPIEWMNDVYRPAGSRCDARSAEPRLL